MLSSLSLCVCIHHIPNEAVPIRRAFQLSLLKVHRALAERALQPLITQDRNTINGDDVGRSFRLWIVEVDLTAVVELDHVFLTVLCDQASLVVIVEERVQTGAIDEDLV